MEHKVINIERDFARYPAGRYAKDGPYSGEAFRDRLLIPALKSGASSLVVEFDGARGLSSSFLEEAFGGLIRAGFEAKDLLKRMQLKSDDPTLIQEVKEYILDQASR